MAKQPPSASASSSAIPEHQASAVVASEAQTEPIFNAAYLHNPAPDYPPMALQRRWEGTVLLKVRVLADGRAEQVTVITSSGHASLDDAAVQAVTAWRFIPARRAGEAIDGWVHVPLVFKAE
ncbi:energy transducer TonB [Trinickia dinghuensis]|uniref:energy transducer TonB n=1 Tax=Trinickia dinghuensis TaxID=2291023 RepID=UPI001FE5BC6E|nr:energy transducer TonB [Trinickia dinghuensis]